MGASSTLAPVTNPSLSAQELQVISFEVKDMTCGHCVRAITEAVHEVDRGAEVAIDLASHRVDITPDRVDAASLRTAIAEAGYTPVDLAAVAAPTEAGQAAAGGCCGGEKRCCG
ncbi:MAG: heavy-metal-associated domain-containing protein [Burkholderiales bacterium]|nr:heavy-metal-associated domain-containing protein [Burkholderiales bacterium]MDE2397387.1 heavy-metal-associated domain-containing protein [Burkholderiales bacterium]